MTKDKKRRLQAAPSLKPADTKESKYFFDHHLWKALTGIIAVLSGLSSAITNGPGLIAKFSPTLPPQKLQVHIGGQPISPGDSTFVYLAAPAPVVSNAYLAFLPLVLTNGGANSLRSLSVVNKSPQQGSVGLADFLTPEVIGPNRREPDVSTDNQDLDGFFVATTRLGLLNPGLAISIDHPFAFHPTETRFPVNPMPGMTAVVDVKYALRLETTVSAADSQLQTYHSSVAMLAAQNKVEAEKQVSQRLAQDIDKQQEGVSFFRRWLTAQKVVALIAFHEPSLATQTEKGSIFYIHYAPKEFTKMTAILRPRMPQWVFSVSPWVFGIAVFSYLLLKWRQRWRQRHSKKA